MRITAKIKNIDKDLCAEVNVKLEANDTGDLLLRSVVYQGILRAMRDANKRAFYEAMSAFAEEDFDAAMEFLSGEGEDNDEE